MTAVYETNTSATVTAYTQIGIVTIEFNHLGKSEISNVTIPVYYEVRKCAKDYSGN